MFKYIIFITLLIFLYSCSNNTIYSGKILNQENFDNINFKNKETLLTKLGNPSFIDPIEEKYFYFSEKKQKKRFLNKDVEYSFVFIFKFDEYDNITDTKVYDLKDKKDIDIIETETSNEIVKRGLLERIFGGVGSQQELPNTP